MFSDRGNMRGKTCVGFCADSQQTDPAALNPSAAMRVSPIRQLGHRLANQAARGCVCVKRGLFGCSRVEKFSFHNQSLANGISMLAVSTRVVGKQHSNNVPDRLALNAAHLTPAGGRLWKPSGGPTENVTLKLTFS